VAYWRFPGASDKTGGNLAHPRRRVL